MVGKCLYLRLTNRRIFLPLQAAKDDARGRKVPEKCSCDGSLKGPSHEHISGTFLPILASFAAGTGGLLPLAASKLEMPNIVILLPIPAPLFTFLFWFETKHITNCFSGFINLFIFISDNSKTFFFYVISVAN